MNSRSKYFGLSGYAGVERGRKRQHQSFMVDCGYRPVSELGGHTNRLDFQINKKGYIPTSDSYLASKPSAANQQRFFKKNYHNTRVKTVNNQEDETVGLERSPLQTCNWQKRQSEFIEKKGKVIGGKKDIQQRSGRQNKAKEETYNKIIEKLSEKQKLIGQLKKLAQTPLLMRDPQMSKTQSYKQNNQAAKNTPSSKYLRQTLQITQTTKQNKAQKMYESIKNGSSKECFNTYTPKRCKIEGQESELSKKGSNFGMVYSPQLYKCQYGKGYEAGNKTLTSVDQLIKGRQRDIKKVTITQSKEDPNINKINSILSKKSKLSQFKIEKQLGEGKFGTVFAAIHRSTGALFALKRIQKETIRIHMMIDQLTTQIKIQSFCNHKNIVRLYDCFSEGQYLYLVLEYMEEGTLFDQLKKAKQKTLTEKQTVEKMKEVTEAVKYLHEQGVAHRDIKPENVVISGGVGKLCDFGWAAICTERRRTYCGTFDYAAPQILQGSQYDMSVDLWCLGVLAYQLLVGKAPFYHISRKQTIAKIKNVDPASLTFPCGISSAARNFIGRLLRKEPGERMGAEEALRHPFLQLS